MGLWTQEQAIAALRTEISDDLNSRIISGFTGIQGVKNGVNRNFVIPQERTLVSGFQLFKNDVLLTITTDFVFLDNVGGFSANGRIQLTTALAATDSVSTTFNFVLSTDIELDHVLNRAANEMGLTTYHTNNSAFGEVPDSYPSDVPDRMKVPIILLAGCKQANLLAVRYGIKYDTSAADQSFSPASMASMYDQIAGRLCPASIIARDDYWKGQGTQFSASQKFVGWILPQITPPR